MGAVYKARQKSLDRLVALKIINPGADHDPDFAERFAREAKTLARLKHPNIVGVHDFGQTEGLFYFVMEYVDGANLRQLIQSRELEPQQALAIVPQICAALQFAHDEGIVHRDVKPENILVDSRGRVKIADYGLAKLLDKSSMNDVTLTGTHQVMGTPRYMAPEQMEGSQDIDHRADIYSLGVVFYELLTGELPLGRFDLPSEKAGVDSRLDDVVLRALAKEPQRRYQHASELKTEVEHFFRPAEGSRSWKGPGRGFRRGSPRGSQRTSRPGNYVRYPLVPVDGIAYHDPGCHLHRLRMFGPVGCRYRLCRDHGRRHHFARFRSHVCHIDRGASHCSFLDGAVATRLHRRIWPHETQVVGADAGADPSCLPPVQRSVWDPVGDLQLLGIAAQGELAAVRRPGGQSKSLKSARDQKPGFLKKPGF